MTAIRLFDTHCHLQDRAFDRDREEAYSRARQAGVGLILAGWDRESSSHGVAFSQQHRDCWSMVGLHPHDARAWDANWPEQLAQWVRQPKVVGIGEIGLDFHYLHSPKAVQEEVFRAQLHLARQWDLPVSIHSREAEAETLAALDEVPGTLGVLHCFTGGPAFARALLDRGLFISFSGIVSFANATEIRAAVRMVPWDRLLIETDAPYLSPRPWRGQRNEPMRVVRVGEVVAEEKNVAPEEVFRHVMANTLRVFPLILSDAKNWQD